MPAIEAQAGLFDYASLTPTTRDIVQRRTGEIQDLMRRTAADIVDIGLKLEEVKAVLGHGNFLPWLSTEFGWTSMTAQRFMQVASAFKNNNLLDLDIAPSALYALASGETPEPIRQEFIQRAEAGEKITHKAVKARKESHEEQFTPPPPAQDQLTPPSATQELLPPAKPAAPRNLALVDLGTGEIVQGTEDYDSPELQAMIQPDESHVITPKAEYEQKSELDGWPDAKRLESVLERAVQALTALSTFSRADLNRIENSPAGRELLTSLRISRVQQLSADFLRVSDAGSRDIAPASSHSTAQVPA